MTSPDWMKPGLFGAAIGAIAVATVGFSWGGWMTGGAAETAASARSKADVVSALQPVCLRNAAADPDRVAKLETIRAASAYQRSAAVMAAGWATMPGETEPNRAVAEACLPGLNIDGA